MGILGSIFGNKSSSSANATTTTTTQTDSRRSNAATGSGISALDGSTVNITTMDAGALGLATASVDQSLGLAKQIATTLGASIGQFGAGATGSIDGLANLLKTTNTSITGQSDKNTQLTMVALAVVGLIAVMSIKGSRA